MNDQDGIRKNGPRTGGNSGGSQARPYSKWPGPPEPFVDSKNVTHTAEQVDYWRLLVGVDGILRVPPAILETTPFAVSAREWYRAEVDARRIQASAGPQTNEKKEASGPGKKNGSPEPGEKKPVKHRLTGQDNAEALIRLHGHDLFYVLLWKKWLVWNGIRWEIDIENKRVTQLAVLTLNEMIQEGIRMADAEEGNRLIRHALDSKEAWHIKGMVELASSIKTVLIKPKELDADPRVLGVRNGSIDLRTGTFRLPSRADRITKSTGVAYNADATCPNWIKFLNLVLKGDTEVIAYLRRAVGYILSGLTGEEVMFVLWGGGWNGKTTFLETLVMMMGDYAVASNASVLMMQKQGGPSEELAQLHGARLLAINETQEGSVLNEERVKYITSNAAITAHRKYEHLFSFQATHKTMVATNPKPVVRGTDEAIWRRLHLVPFTEVIPEKDRDPQWREKFLVPELPGILNWALEGLAEYWRIGLSPPAAVRSATEEYRGEMDDVGQWFDECCELNPAETVVKSHLYDDFKVWYRRAYNRETHRSSTSFGNSLSSLIKRRGLNVRIEKRSMGGVRLKQPAQGDRELPF